MVSPPVLSVVTPALGTGVSGAGSASSRGWATVEIRLLILELLDRRDLAMLLRVERRLTSPVSRLLYREVRPSEAAWMNRMTVSWVAVTWIPDLCSVRGYAESYVAVTRLSG